VTAELAAQIAGCLQLLQLPGMTIGRKLLGWREDLERLTPVNRGLILAMALGIIAYVLGTGVLALTLPGALVGPGLGRALCLVQALSWTLRVSLQVFAIGRVWPQHARWLHRSLVSIYGSLAVIYAGLVVSATSG
jgi:hypothetical protein